MTAASVSTSGALAVTGTTSLGTLQAGAVTAASISTSGTGSVTSLGTFISPSTGTAALPSYTFTSNTTCGMYLISAGNVGLSSNSLCIAASGSSNVSLCGSLPSSYSSGQGVIYLNSAAVSPSTFLSTGGYLYVAATSTVLMYNGNAVASVTAFSANAFPYLGTVPNGQMSGSGFLSNTSGNVIQGALGSSTAPTYSFSTLFSGQPTSGMYGTSYGAAICNNSFGMLAAANNNFAFGGMPANVTFNGGKGVIYLYSTGITAPSAPTSAGVYLYASGNLLNYVTSAGSSVVATGPTSVTSGLFPYWTGNGTLGQDSAISTNGAGTLTGIVAVTVSGLSSLGTLTVSGATTLSGLTYYTAVTAPTSLPTTGSYLYADPTTKTLNVANTTTIYSIPLVLPSATVSGNSMTYWTGTGTLGVDSSLITNGSGGLSGISTLSVSGAVTVAGTVTCKAKLQVNAGANFNGSVGSGGFSGVSATISNLLLTNGIVLNAGFIYNNLPLTVTRSTVFSVDYTQPFFQAFWPTAATTITLPAASTYTNGTLLMFKLIPTYATTSYNIAFNITTNGSTVDYYTTNLSINPASGSTVLGGTTCLQLLVDTTNTNYPNNYWRMN